MGEELIRSPPPQPVGGDPVVHLKTGRDLIFSSKVLIRLHEQIFTRNTRCDGATRWALLAGPSHMDAAASFNANIRGNDDVWREDTRMSCSTGAGRSKVAAMRQDESPITYFNSPSPGKRKRVFLASYSLRQTRLCLIVLGF